MSDKQVNVTHVLPLHAHQRLIGLMVGSVHHYRVTRSVHHYRVTRSVHHNRVTRSVQHYRVTLKVHHMTIVPQLITLSNTF